MEYIIVAFRSRTHTIGFSQYLSKFNIPNEIVNTPKEAGVGCGLSVKVACSSFAIVKSAVRKANYNSFAGFFLVKTYLNKRMVKSI